MDTKNGLLVVSLLAAVSAWAVGAPAKTNALLAESQPLILGQGYVSDTGAAALRTCFVKPTYTYAGPASSFITLGNKVSASEIQKDLISSFSESVGYGLFSESGSADYARHITDNAYTDNFSFSATTTFPQRIADLDGVGTDVLNDTGKAFYKLGSAQFRLACGDDYVKSQALGDKLFVNMQIDFDTTTDKENFDASLGVGVGNIFNASGSIQQAVNQSHAKGTVEISAYQLGGVPTELSQILQKSPSGDYYIVQCSLTNLAACNNAINGIISYAQNNFAKQVSFKNGAVTGPGTPVVLSNSMIAVETAFALDTGNPLATPEVEAARKKLAELYYANNNHWVDVTAILNSDQGAVLKPDLKANIISLQRALADNKNTLQDYQNGAIQCYLQPQQCVAIANNIQAELEATDLSILKPLQYCMTFGDVTDSTNLWRCMKPTGAPGIYEDPVSSEDLYYAEYKFPSVNQATGILEFRHTSENTATFSGTRASANDPTYRGSMNLAGRTYRAWITQEINPYYPSDLAH